MQDYPLSGLKIIEIPNPYIPVASAYCAKLLADYGAEVIRIDAPSRDARFSKEAQFLYLNTNKKRIALDLMDEVGVAAFEKMVAKADIVVESDGSGKLDYASFGKLNPALIWASISWFGADGPYRNFHGSDMVVQALGGVMHFTGLPDHAPLKLAGPQAEYQAGINAAVAIMTALYVRDATGQGQHIDISAMEVLTSILEGALLSYAYDGTVRSRGGARHPTIYPSTILPCKDGYVHVDASTDWETFARFTGIEKLLDFDPQTLRTRADEIDELLVAWLAAYTREEIFKKAQEWRLPFAMVMGIDELEADPQFQSRGYFGQIDHPVAGVRICPGAPFKMDSDDCRK